MNYIKTQYKQPPSSEKMLKVLVIMLSAIFSAFIFSFLYNSFNTPDHPISTVLPRPVLNENFEQKPPEIVAVDEWRSITVKSGDSLSTIFISLGLSEHALKSLLSDHTLQNNLRHLTLGQELRFKISADHKLEMFVFPLSATRNLILQAQANDFISHIEEVKLQTQTHFVAGKIKSSLYVDGKKQHIPVKLLQQLTKIFAWQIDFAKDIQPGDSYSILYEELLDKNSRHAGIGDILAVEFINLGEPYQAIRFTNSQGKHEYYSPKGISLQKSFLRFPVHFSRISSQFSLRRHHPVLHIIRPHLGVDLAAPMGTPILAASKGKIVFMGRKGGYGNLVKIQHDHKYTTLYAHMLRFYKGLDLGSIVSQGQIIGYVGQSGMADGPHLHYEFRVNKKPVNPLTIDLPMENSLPKSILAKFKSTSKALLAQLELYHDAVLASN